MTKEVTLPKKMEQEAHLFAQIELEHQDLGPDSDEGRKVYQQAFMNFCREAFEHSLTPSGELGSNPISKKYLASADSLVDNLNIRDAKTKAVLKKRIKTAIDSLVSAYYEFWEPKARGLGEKGKRRTLIKKERYSVFEQTKDNKKNSEKLVETEKVLYQRLFLTTLLIMSVYQVMSKDWISQPINLKKYIPSLSEKELSDPKLLYKKLRKPESRQEFISSIFDKFKLGDLESETMPSKVFESKEEPKEKEEVSFESLKNYALNTYQMTLARKKDSFGYYYSLIPVSFFKIPFSDKKEAELTEVEWAEREKYYKQALDGKVVKDFPKALKAYNEFYDSISAAQKEIETMKAKSDKTLSDEITDRTGQLHTFVKSHGGIEPRQFLGNHDLRLEHINRFSEADIKSMIDASAKAITPFLEATQVTMFGSNPKKYRIVPKNVRRVKLSRKFKLIKKGPK